MFWKYLKIGLLLFCCTSGGFSAMAQSKTDSIQQMDELIIDMRPFADVIPSQKLSGEDLEKLNSHSVADALRYFAGVQIKDYGGMGGLKTVNVRNMGSAHVGVFYNGISIGNAQNGTVDLGKFSLDDVEEISLYNGQKSEIFQSAKDFASASAIYIRAKRPVFENDKKTNATLRYKAGSYNTHNPSFRLEHKINERFLVTLSSEYLHSPGDYKFHFTRNNSDGSIAHDTTAYRQNSDIESFRLESAVYNTFKDESTLETNLYYYTSNRGLPGAIVKKKFSNGERLEDQSFFVQSAYTKNVSDKYKMQLKGKFAYDATHYHSLDTVRLFDGSAAYRNMLYDNKYFQQEFYTTFINKYSILPNWDVSLSVDFDYNKLNATFNNKAGLQDTLTYGSPFSYPERYSVLSSLATAVNLGKVKAQASLIGTFVHEKVRFNTKAPDKSVLTPALFLAYKPFRETDFNIRFFYKEIFRMPTFNDLYYTQIGYSLLKPEYTHQLNLGFAYNKVFKNKAIPSVSLQADAYYMNVKDKIIAAPTGSFFRWMMTNMGKVEGHGVDVKSAFHSQVNAFDFGLNLNYSYSVARDFTKVGGFKKTSYGDQIPYTPWHSGSAIVSASYKSWALNYSFIYVGERYNGAVNNIEVNKVQPWYTHDLAVQKDFQWGNYRFKGSLECNNLLNQYYEVVLNYPMPGRNFKFIISCNF